MTVQPLTSNEFANSRWASITGLKLHFGPGAPTTRGCIAPRRAWTSPDDGHCCRRFAASPAMKRAETLAAMGMAMLIGYQQRMAVDAVQLKVLLDHYLLLAGYDSMLTIE